MKWIKLKRNKIRVYGKPAKILMKGLTAPEEHTHFLHGLLTNDIKSLKPYTFNYNLWLKQNGNPIADFFVYKIKDYYILDTEEDADFVINEFTRLKLSLKVYFDNLNLYEHVFIYGEGAEAFVKEKFGIELKDYEVKEIKEDVFIAKNPVRLKETGFDLFGNIEEFFKELPEEGQVSEDEFEEERIKNCVPRIHKELREGFSPLEAGVLSYAISLNKGCYVGQEAIARVYFRGRTPRTLVKFEILEGVKEGNKILEDGKAIGLITSVSPSGNTALGYMLRAKLELEKEYRTEEGRVKVLEVCEGGKAQ
ncbi:MAG: folate-binding protein [Aquifex sp.]|nr:MAG: folate-binding protein [Aquifex sp.]